MVKYIDSDYVSIIPTAYATAYPRIYTDIPYWKEIFDQLETILKENHLPAVDEDSKITRLAPELEARYVLIDKLLGQTDSEQILELASGLSPRGILATSDQSMRYVELDLPDMAAVKKEIIRKLGVGRPNLEIVSGNALRIGDLESAVASFDSSKQVAVIHEGLLRYLNFDEKAQVAQNVRALLERFGGVWITCDTTPKKFLAVQDTTTSPGLNKTLIATSGKNFYDNMFEDEHHVERFFGDLGFSIEFHRFDEVLGELKSPKKLELSVDETKSLLKSGTVVVMRLKPRSSPRSA